MLPTRVLPLALVLALGVGAPPAGGHGGGDDGARTGEAPLLPPDGGPQPEARGSIEVLAAPDRQRFEVEVEAADPTVPLFVFIRSEIGVETSLGTLATGNGEIEFDTGEGMALPLGAASVEALAGLSVEVRDAEATLVLAGTVPAPGEGHGDDDGDDDADDDEDGHGDDDDDDHADRRPARGRAALMRADTSPFADASGRVEVERKHGEEELEIEAEHLDAGTAVEFFLADEGGTMTSVGAAEADDGGEAEIEFETDDGDPLPLGAASVDELAGRRVEVRLAADGTLILFGEVPEATTAARKLRGRTDVRDLASRARCRVRALVDGRAGRERLDVDLKAVASGGAEAELFVDDGGGSMVLAGTVALRGSGRGRLRYDTRKGDRLPLGAASLRDLEGRDFEIRVDGRELMSSRAHGSEEEMARLACRPDAERVLVGGLGMGYTLRAALDALGGAAAVTVAEVVPAVVEWNRGPLAHLARSPLADPRVTIHAGDVAAYLRAATQRFDAILLDVDNGPQALTRKANQLLYSPPGLELLRRSLRPRGTLAVWSADRSPAFLKDLRRAHFDARSVDVPARGPSGGPNHTIFLAQLARP